MSEHWENCAPGLIIIVLATALTAMGHLDGGAASLFVGAAMHLRNN